MKLIKELCDEYNVILLEDVCESHGATYKKKKLGTFGLVSNFSFYSAPHLSTLEGGMVCTNAKKIYELVRMLRAHGMARESGNQRFEKETIKKEKKGFKEYPTSDKLKGDQLFVNSDRIILSAKASEFIIFGKGNTGVITDGQYSVDAAKDIYLHTDNNVTIHSKGANQIFLNSENGKIYLGKNSGEGDAGAAVQTTVG